jgi:hypothetical protein
MIRAMDPDFDSLQEFVRDACPSSWLDHAEELRDSAAYLWARNEDSLGVSLTLDRDFQPTKEIRVSAVSRTYMLLSGFALENVMKGRLVAVDPSLVNQGFLGGKLKSHNIVDLASEIPNLTLSIEEQQFCLNATKAIPYWGRYPIPLKKSQLLPEIRVDEILRHAFLGLFQRLAHDLYWAVRDGWDSEVGPKTLKFRSVRYGDSIDLKEPLF